MLMSDATQTGYQTKTGLTSHLVYSAKLAMVIHFRTQKESNVQKLAEQLWVRQSGKRSLNTWHLNQKFGRGNTS